MTSPAARPHCRTARAGRLRFGAFLLPAALLLTGCDNLNTDNITPKNIGAFFLRTLCRSVSNCGVNDPQ